MSGHTHSWWSWSWDTLGSVSEGEGGSQILFKPFVIYSGIYLSLETACVAQLQEAKRLEELGEKKRREIGDVIKASGCVCKGRVSSISETLCVGGCLAYVRSNLRD